MRNDKILKYEELDAVVGGWTSCVTEEATSYVGKEVWLVHNCEDGFENFTKVRITGTKNNPKLWKKNTIITFDVIADRGNRIETNMSGFYDTEVELGTEKNPWNIFLDY